MRNTLKATTLESKLPLLAVEHGCIISKDADINGGLRGQPPGTVHRNIAGIRKHARRMEQGYLKYCRIIRWRTSRTGSCLRTINGITER